jgi:MSHA biogenesis protein MshO
MKRALSLPRRAHGFTLVEAVIVIAIIGVIGAIVAVFIRAPILGYRDAVERAEMTDQADLTLRRMARDIRLALPNSVRVMKNPVTNDDVIEFLQTRSGGRYVSAEDGLPDTVPPLSFDDQTKVTFTALAPMGTFLSQVRAGDYVVVYNLGEGFAPANAYDLRQPTDPRCPPVSKAGNIACVTSIAQGSVTIGTPVTTATIGLNGNPFARQDVPLVSPEQRFQIVSGPVSYYCEAQTDGTSILWRAWDYPINAAQVIPTGGKRAMVASRLASCNGIFRYGDSASASRRAGLVVIALEFRGRNNSGATIRLIHQVHVDNTP